MKFQYSGRDSSGKQTSGSIEAASRDAAGAELMRLGILPSDLQDQSEDVDLASLMQGFFPQKVTTENLIILCRQMRALTKAGVPLLRALRGLVDSIDNRTLRDVLSDVAVAVEGGSALAAALAKYPKIFGNIFISMVNVGENSGKLDEALQQIVFYLEMDRDTKKRMKQATRYPTIVVCAVVVAVVIINIFVVPAFAKMFEKFDAELPLATRILIGSSNFMINYWWLLLIIMGGAYYAFKRYVNTDDGRVKWDGMKLRTPIFGPIFTRIVLARFSRLYAMLSSAGVPILPALNALSKAIGNAYMEKAILTMNHAIERGDTFTRCAANTQMFTPLVLQMLAVGEETGQIDEMLVEVAQFYEEEVDYDLKQLGDAIEPILLMFMGGLVLVLALGIFLPMWELGRAVK
ncbi:MAG: type II secretion system F family protein [Pseudomonadota bacterium]